MLNYCLTQKGRIKFGGYKGGRGYCGWYVTKDNKHIFLRSLVEFVVAKKLDYENKYFLSEKIIYTINNEVYKPDFFIYSDNTYSKIIKIIEVKSSFDEANLYLNKFKQYFKDINIIYETDGYNIDIRRKKYDFFTQSDIKNWKDQYIKNYNVIDYTGSNNPMYNIKHSENTKIKIGKETKRYMKLPEIKKKHDLAIKKFWDSDEGLIAKKKQSEVMKKRYADRLKILNETNPIIEKNCLICNSVFLSRTMDNQLVCKNNKCKHKYNAMIGKYKTYKKTDFILSYKNKILKYMKLISEDFDINMFDALIIKYKKLNIIPLNFGLSLKTVNKYFNTFENFKMEISNG